MSPEAGPRITEEGFLNGDVSIRQPRALSFRDQKYAELYGNHFTMSDVKSLCAILLHSPEEIFTRHNLNAISIYGEISFGEEKQMVGSSRVKDLLLDISKVADGQKKQARMTEILHDVSQLLNKHDSEELKLKVAAYNNLIKKGYITIES